MRSLTVFLAGVVLLGGCAGKPTVSEHQCAAGDWQTIGYSDGARGLRSSQLLKHQDACLEHGVVPVRADYMLGWEEGVREYCDPNNGFYVGERGWQHNNVCPADMRVGFESAYREGRKLYQARVDVANLEWELEQKTTRLSEVKSLIVSKAAAQLDGTLTTTERVDLATQVQRLYEERERLQREIPDLEAELAIKSRELDQLNQSMASLSAPDADQGLR